MCSLAVEYVLLSGGHSDLECEFDSGQTHSLIQENAFCIHIHIYTIGDRRNIHSYPLHHTREHILYINTYICVQTMAET